MIDYIVKYQNNYVSSYLFEKIMSQLITKGVKVAKVLNSSIFHYTFDFDEWPSTHTNDKKYIRPYNDSVFSLRKNYNKVFHEEEF